MEKMFRQGLWETRRLLMRYLSNNGLFSLAVLAAAVALMPAAARANVLVNPGFETPSAAGGDVFATTANSGWNGFNAAFITASTKRTGLQSLKTFGAPG